MADPDDVDGGAGPEKMLRILWIVAGVLALGIGVAYVLGGNRAVEKTVASVAVLPLSGEGSPPVAAGFAETLSRSLRAIGKRQSEPSTPRFFKHLRQAHANVHECNDIDRSTSEKN